MVEFTGAATPMSDGAIADAAARLGCEEAAVRAVIDVESKGGFLKDKRPKILFERHYFCRLTGGKHDAVAPEISRRAPGGYLGGAREYERLEQAIALDPEAALKSASWGAFQIMGANHKAAGYDTVEEFCAACVESEDRQLDAFVSFVKSNGLADELRRRDWAGFARGYNGPHYKKYDYDQKLAAAFLLHTSSARAEGAARTLRMGDEGDDVKALQTALGMKPDGDFGPRTKRAVVRFQRKSNLSADGIVGSATREKLGL